MKPNGKSRSKSHSLSRLGWKFGWIGVLFAALFFSAGTVNAGVTTLFNFSSDSHGGQPGAPLVEGTDGYLYGTTSTGGTNGAGTIFRESRDGGTPKTLYSFPDGANPLGGPRLSGLALASDGKFYGTTYGNGATNQNGSIFQITTSGDFQTIYPFSAFNPGTSQNSDGAYPEGGLVFDSADGNLYGTAAAGGQYGYGTVFRVTTDGGFKMLYAFQNADTASSPNGDGTQPQAVLAIGPDGALYGTTYTGGQYTTFGTAFRVTTDGTSFTTIHEFSNGTDGGAPNGLTLLDDGNFYGTAQSGGANNWGTVFRMDPTGNVTTIYPFANGSDGSVPFGNVITRQGQGALFGTTTNNGGTVFALSLTAGSLNQLSTIHTFDPSTGTIPVATLLYLPTSFWPHTSIASTFALYGSTKLGGSSANGTLFRISPLKVPIIKHVFPLPFTFESLFKTGLIILKFSDDGAFSGKAVVNGVRTRLSGGVDIFGGYNSPPGSLLPISLSVSGTGSGTGGPALTGSVDGQSLSALPVAYGKGETVAEAGKYTIVLSQTNTSTAVPQGSGYATLTVGKTGEVMMAGKLADGTAFTSSGPLVGGGPAGGNEFIVSVLTARTVLTGAISFLSAFNSYSINAPSQAGPLTDLLPILPNGNCGGTLSWTKNPVRSIYYGGGFPASLQAAGALYAPPAGTGFPASADNGVFSATGGGVAGLQEMVTLSTTNKVTDNGPNFSAHLKVTVDAVKGSFTGSFLDSGSMETIPFGGVFIQPKDSQGSPYAAGFFLGPVSDGAGLSGSVMLEPQL